jgi:EAL domain-containing protein (putative c-di-GMP-specific phosphodiesterase class I)
MVKALNFSVVVEGVERKEQLAVIKEIIGEERSLIQGFYYSKPLTVNDFNLPVDNDGIHSVKNLSS